MRKNEFISKGVKLKTKSKIINLLLHTKAFVIFKNWLFQGFFDLSLQEKIYKILLDIILVFLFLLLLEVTLLNILVALFIAHSINWVTNDHFVDNLCHLELITMNPAKMEDSIAFLKSKIETKTFITFAGIYGRISRGDEVHAGTDIDIRLLQSQGFLPSIKTCFLGHYLRFVCLFKLIPIDLNIWHKKNDLLRMRKDENPLIIIDQIDAKSLYNEMEIKLLPRYKQFDVR